jgi:hypothetical protein
MCLGLQTTIAKLEQTIADQRQELERLRGTPATAAAGADVQLTTPNAGQEQAQTPDRSPQEVSKAMDNTPGHATNAEAGEQSTPQPHTQGAVVIDYCYAVAGSRCRSTEALLNIELHGSRIVGGRIKEVSILLRAFPHRKKVQSGSIISAPTVGEETALDCS